jgi:hypothetical protein
MAMVDPVSRVTIGMVKNEVGKMFPGRLLAAS